MITNGGINYRIMGQGPGTIIFVHGFACGLEDWQPQIEALSPQFRCVALDLPGHGRSARRDAPTMRALGAAVNEVRKQVDGQKTILVGHSLGVKVIREAYCAASDGVAGLVFIDGAFYDSDRETMLARAAAAIDSGGFAAYAASHFAGMFTEHSDPMLRERIVSRAAKLDPAFGRALYLEAVTWDPARGKDTLRAIAVPVLVLQSTRIGSDLRRQPLRAGMKTSFMDLVEELVPRSEAKVIAGVGHFAMNEAPDEVNRAIGEFVTRVVQA